MFYKVLVIHSFHSVDDQLVVLRLKQPIGPGQYMISITYGSVMRDDLMGCYMSVERDTPFITSQFEPNYARTCIPTFDEPDIKMAFDVTVSVPETMDLYFNTKAISSETTTIYNGDIPCIPSFLFIHVDTYKRVHFAPTPVMSAYLLAFAAGSYTSLSSPTKYPVMVEVIVPSCRQ